MTGEILALTALVLAAIPSGLFLLNLWFYRRTAKHSSACVAEAGFAPAAVSVLIPARNEASNIQVTLQSVLANTGVEFEVVVLDDHSTDGTAEIVRSLAARDARVRLESAPALPSGWCGKQHACHVLARHARHPLLVFLDADVRLAPDALARMAGFMRRQAGIPDGKTDATAGTKTCRPIALASGVPRQELGTFSERLLIPLIHFVLLGYLPMFMMRWTRRPEFSAGCGQLFIAWADIYHAVGGHAQIRATLHDGVKLPRAFRRAGWATDLFDATDLADCRMYRTDGETWRGLGKNATEGLAAPGAIVPMTVFLLGGQVLPFGLLAGAVWLSPTALTFSLIAAGLALLPRWIGSRQFRQPVGSVWLHPLGVTALLLIQWVALARSLAGRPAEWKGRHYSPQAVTQPAQTP